MISVDDVNVCNFSKDYYNNDLRIFRKKKLSPLETKLVYFKQTNIYSVT